ncbi:MAG: hypothetical protein AB7K35_04355 [Pseudorhodoplanes sp.]
MAKKFKGVIKLDVRDSKPDWGPYPLAQASKGAPNILVVLYGDTGLSARSPFGGGDAVSEDYKTPGECKGGTILFVAVTVEKKQYLDLEKLAAAAFAVD